MSLKHLPSKCADVAESQGWSDETLVILLSGFISGRGLEDDLLSHLLSVAEEENVTIEDED